MTKKFFILCFFIFFQQLIYADQSKSVEITAVGDILPGYEAEELLKQKGYDYLFDSTRYLLQKTDVLIGNVKSVFSLKNSSNKKITLNYFSPPESAKAFVNAGFHVISFASNHFGDLGAESVKETFDVLSSSGIIFIGAGENLSLARNLKVIETKGVRIGFLSYSNKGPDELYATQSSAGVAPLLMDMFKLDIETAKKNVDVLVVSVHWGDAYRKLPNNKQVVMARNMINFGADVILGHYPHVLQGIEIYNGGVIAYSLGTFAFGSYFNTAQNVKEGMILKLKIEEKKVKEVSIIPINVDNQKIKFQPNVLRGKNAVDVINNMKSYSTEFSTQINEKNGIGYIYMDKPYEKIIQNKNFNDYISSFDINNVLTHIDYLSKKIGSRTQGSDEEKRAFQYIKENLIKFGYEVEEQSFNIENEKKSYNIIAKKQASQDTNIIVIGAHVDSVPMGPGANDNASGAAVVLEVARVMKNIPLHVNVVFAFFGAEEGTQNYMQANSFGSKYFTRQLSYENIKKIIGMMNVDMVGNGKNFVVGNVQRSNEWFSAWIRFQGERLGYPMVPYNKDIGGSDQVAFEQKGIPIAYLEWYQDFNYHTARDTMDNLKLDNLLITGQVIIASLLNL